MPVLLRLRIWLWMLSGSPPCFVEEGTSWAVTLTETSKR